MSLSAMAVIEEIEEGDVPLTKEDMAKLLQVNTVAQINIQLLGSQMYYLFFWQHIVHLETSLNFRTTPSL